MNSSLLFDQFTSNIQEIIYIEWLFELICMFSFCLFIIITNDQEKRKYSKTGESSKLLVYYCAIVKYMCIFFIS